MFNKAHPPPTPPPPSPPDINPSSNTNEPVPSSAPQSGEGGRWTISGGIRRHFNNEGEIPTHLPLTKCYSRRTPRVIIHTYVRSVITWMAFTLDTSSPEFNDSLLLPRHECLSRWLDGKHTHITRIGIRHYLAVTNAPPWVCRWHR